MPASVGNLGPGFDTLGCASCATGPQSSDDLLTAAYRLEHDLDAAASMFGGPSIMMFRSPPPPTRIGVWLLSTVLVRHPIGCRATHVAFSDQLTSSAILPP